MKSVGVDVSRDHQNDVAGHTIEEAVDLIGNGKVQWFAVTASIICLMSYVVDILGFGLVLPAAECDLQMDTYRKGLLSSAPFLGLTISAHSWGFLADFIGRRKSICLSLTSCAIFSFLAAIMPNYWIIFSMRLGSGISLSGALSAMYPYLAELLKSTTRSKLMVLIGYAMGLGIVFTTGVGWTLQRFNVHVVLSDNYILHPWRIQMIIALVPGIIAAVIYYYLPESPKFLVATGDSEKAVNVLKDIYRSNGQSVDGFPIRSLMVGQETVTCVKKTFVSAITSMIHETKVLFRNPCLLPMLGTCLIQYALFTVSAGYLMWYPEITNRLQDNASSSTRICEVFSGRTNATAKITKDKTGDECDINIPDKVYIDSLAIALSYFVTNTIIYFCHMKFQLRHITIGAMIISCASAFLMPNLTNEIWIIACFACFVTGSSVGISIFNVVLVEIFPNYLCGMAISLGLLTGRIATFVGTGGLGILLEKYCEPTVYGTGFLLVVGITSLFLLPKKINMSKQ